MPSTDHHRHHNELASRVPPPGEAVGLPRQPDRQPDVGVARDNLEEKVEDAVRLGVGDGVRRLDQGDYEKGQRDEPHVVRKLAPQVLGDKVHLALCRVECGLWMRLVVEEHLGRTLEAGLRGNAHTLEVVHSALDLLADEGGAAPTYGG